MNTNLCKLDTVWVLALPLFVADLSLILERKGVFHVTKHATSS
jgi:hypothetical protein